MVDGKVISINMVHNFGVIDVNVGFFNGVADVCHDCYCEFDFFL